MITQGDYFDDHAFYTALDLHLRDKTGHPEGPPCRGVTLMQLMQLIRRLLDELEVGA